MPGYTHWVRLLKVKAKPFRYMHLGDLATIGRRAAVVKFGPLELKGFIGWVFWFAGTTFIAQFEVLRAVITAQFNAIMIWAERVGLMHAGSTASIGDQLLGSVGRLTSQRSYDGLGRVSFASLMIEFHAPQASHRPCLRW